MPLAGALVSQVAAFGELAGTDTFGHFQTSR
jgi:hypothetical protein